MYPVIKFKIDKKKDLDALMGFLMDAQFDDGRNLKWAVLDKYPVIRKFFNENMIKDKKGIISFIENIYNKSDFKIKNNLNIYENNWKKVEIKFFKLVEDIFLDKNWPKGRYEIYPTIWGMFPRSIEDKTFQVPYKRRNKKYVNVIIAHEMLHFIFYDYFYNKYPKYKKDKYNFLAWNVSEIFNEIIQNSPLWLDTFKLKTMGYPEHEKIVKVLEKKYYKKNNIDIGELIEEIIVNVNK